MDFQHISVLMNETIESLQIKPEGTYVDGTLGGAGHASMVCSRLSGKGRFVGLDQDKDAIAVSTERLKKFGDRVTIVKSNYLHMKQVLKELGIDRVDGILLDLGVSSYQLDNAERGFSYRQDAPLDMRMDTEQGVCAKDIVNGYEESELMRIFREYGEERFAKRIAANIVRTRQKKELETTMELVDIIRDSLPAKARNGKGHPAKRVFQAIRIECNRELEVLRESLDEMVELLGDRGRLCVITFHSLEDRIVKTNFRKNENPCVCPPDFPICVCGKQSRGKVITRKAILPSEEEQQSNPRSKSAKLRVFERNCEEGKKE